MKQILLACIFVTLLSFKACQTDDSKALYQQNQTSTSSSSQVSELSPDQTSTSSINQTEAATSEFSGTLYDETYGGNIIVDGYSIFCYSRPDSKLESNMLTSDPQYLILSNSEASTLRTFIDQVVNNLYIMNYTNVDEKENQTQRETLFSPDIAQLINTTLDTQVNIRSEMTKYKLTTDIISATILQNNFVSKFLTNGGDTIYRVWLQFPLNIVSSGDNGDSFFEYNPQYYKGETMIDVWMYIKIPADKKTEMQVVGMTERISAGSYVSVYAGTSNGEQVERPSTIIENRSAKYVQDNLLSNDQIVQITSSARTFENALYSGDKTTLTETQMKKTVLPLCTDELKDKLTNDQYFEKYSQDIQDTNAKLSRSDYSTMLAGMTQDVNGGYTLQEFQLDNGSMAYLYCDSWLGSLVADKDLEKMYGLNRCEMQNGKRIYTTFFFYELVNGEFYIADFTTYETGMGEMDGTGNG